MTLPIMVKMELKGDSVEAIAHAAAIAVSELRHTGRHAAEGSVPSISASPSARDGEYAYVAIGLPNTDPDSSVVRDRDRMINQVATGRLDDHDDLDDILSRPVLDNPEAAVATKPVKTARSKNARRRQRKRG